MNEIDDCIDWFVTYNQYLPRKYEHLGSYKTHKDLKNDPVDWGFNPESIMPEFLYECGLLEEFADYLKNYTHSFYLSWFSTYYSKLYWWSMFQDSIRSEKT